MSNVAETSIQSWIKLQPTLGKKQKTMLKFFQDHPGIKFSNRHLSHNLNWPINQVTPRCKELRELDLIEFAGVIYDHTTQRNVKTWRLKK